MTAPDERDDMRAPAADLALAALSHDEVIKLHGNIERAASRWLHRDRDRDSGRESEWLSWDLGWMCSEVAQEIRRRCGADGAL